MCASFITVGKERTLLESAAWWRTRCSNRHTVQQLPTNSRFLIAVGLRRILSRILLLFWFKSRLNYKLRIPAFNQGKLQPSFVHTNSVDVGASNRAKHWARCAAIDSIEIDTLNSKLCRMNRTQVDRLILGNKAELDLISLLIRVNEQKPFQAFSGASLKGAFAEFNKLIHRSNCIC